MPSQLYARVLVRLNVEHLIGPGNKNSEQVASLAASDFPQKDASLFDKFTGRLKLHHWLGRLIADAGIRLRLRLRAVVAWLCAFGCVHISEPVARSFAFTFGDLEKGLLNFFSYRTAPARANRNAIYGADGRDFGGGAGEEEFVSHVEGGALNAPFLHDNSQLVTN